jgi:hypothetical protein
MNLTTPLHPTTSRSHRTATRALVIGTATLAALLVTAPTQAYEPRQTTHTAGSALLSPYATPLQSLAGMTAAQYIAEHESHILAYPF